MTAGRKSSFDLSETCCRECLGNVFHLKQQEGYAWLSAAGWQPVSVSGRPVWLHIYRDPPPPPPLPLCQEKANFTSVSQIVLRVKERLDSHQPCYIFQLNCYSITNRNGREVKRLFKSLYNINLPLPICHNNKEIAAETQFYNITR